MMPITLGVEEGKVSERGGMKQRVECRPHLIDVRRECEPEGVARDGLTSFETGGPEGEVHLNFVSVFAERVRPGR